MIRVREVFMTNDTRDQERRDRMSDRERISKAASDYAAPFVNAVYGAVRHAYVNGAQAEATHWEQRCRGLVEAIEGTIENCEQNGERFLVDDLIQSLAAFRASADDAPEGK